jgi:cytidylate kinase
MESNAAVVRFLEGQTFERPGPDGEPGTRPFVTISRQAGAGGRSLAEALLTAFNRRVRPELFGWSWADQEVCERLARDPRLRDSLDALVGERFRGPLEDALAAALAGSTPQLALYRAAFRVERGLAAAGRVILVGRGGVSAARGLPGGVHVRLVGARTMRLERVAARNGWTRAQAGVWVDEQDRARERLLREYFNASLADPLLFHATFNTDTVSPDVAAEAVAELVLARSRVAAPV